jgi:plastocyanin
MLAACSSGDGYGGAKAPTTTGTATTATNTPASTTAAPGTTIGPSTTAGPSSTSSASPPSTTRATTSTTLGPTITVSDFTFRPASVPAGSTVRLLNADATEHTVESRDGLWTFDSTTQTFTAPATAGTYGVFCAIHSSMSGTLTVT